MGKKNKSLGGLLSTGMTNIVGIGMIGATAGAVNSLPAGTTKDIAGVIPGLQGVSLIGHNLKALKSKGSGWWK